jgi:hypothetical protein
MDADIIAAFVFHDDTRANGKTKRSGEANACSAYGLPSMAVDEFLSDVGTSQRTMSKAQTCFAELDARICAFA